MSDEGLLKLLLHGQSIDIKKLRVGEQAGQQKHVWQIFGWKPAPHRGKLLPNSIYSCKEHGSAASCVERKSVTLHSAGAWGKAGAVEIDSSVCGTYNLYCENRTRLSPVKVQQLSLYTFN